MYLNARSIANKIPDLLCLVQEENPDVICITETWLDNRISTESLRLNGYQVLRVDRAFGANPHGGVLIAAKSKLNPTFIPHNTENEVAFLNIKMNRQILRLVVAYRTTALTQAENQLFIDFIQAKLENLQCCVMVGDFNYPGIDWVNLTTSTGSEQLFLDLVLSNSLHQKILQPTRENNILDLCLCTDEDLVSEVDVRDTFSTSDHCYFVCNINMYPFIERVKTVKNFNRADWDLIRGYLALVDWSDLFYGCDCAEMWTRFRSVIDHAVELFVPTFVLGPHKTSPWYNSFIKRLIRKKRIKYDRYKINRTRRNKRSYNKYCKYVKKETLKAKINYERKLFLNKNKSPKSFYSYVNKATKKNSDSYIPPLVVDGETIIDDRGKADALSAQYKSVFTIDNGVFPACQQRMPTDSLTSINITDEDVLISIRALEPSGAPGEDEIYPVFIKKTSCYLIFPLRKLFQSSLNAGFLPVGWRKGVIVPIYKKNGQPSSPASYRPICLTSVICKLMERIIHRHFLRYLNGNALISDSQHGFLKCRSTTTNLLECLNDWTKYIDERYPVDIIYIDLAKAFDSISHSKMLYKLRKIGIGGQLLEWFENFLCVRSQSVRVGDSMSDSVTVTSGIGQGTILGPLLFIIYMDGSNDAGCSSQLKLYADDAKLYRHVESLDECSILQDDLQKLDVFFGEWQLKVNTNKCEVIHLGFNNNESDYFLNDTSLPVNIECRDLGITISSDNRVRKHCSNIVRNAYFSSKQLKLGFSCTILDFQIYMYKTYVRPLLEYNSQIWSPYLISDINLVEKVQRSFTKRLPGMAALSYLQRLSRLQLESLESRRIFNDLVLFHKIVHGLVDVDVHEFVTFNANNTRGHSLKVNIQYSRINFRKNYFINRTSPIWNGLPRNVVEASSSNLFKTRLRDIDLTVYCRGRAHTA